MLTLNQSYNGSVTMKQWILQMELQQVVMNQQQCQDPSKSTSHALLHASCLLQGRGCRGDVCVQIARGSRAIVPWVCWHSPTNARAYCGRNALLPHCHQLSHMQPASEGAKCVIIVTLWGTIGVLLIVSVI